MADERLLSEDEAALVFRRAAELEATAPGEQQAFDAETLERIGAEAGLSPVAIRQAVAELRAGRLEPTGRRRLPALVPNQVVIERRLAAPAAAVTRRLETYLRRQRFAVCRRRGNLTVWEPSRGLVDHVLRSTDVIDRLRLSKVDGVQLHVEPGPEGRGSHVRIVLDVGRARSNARTGSITGAALGATGVVAAGAGVVLGAAEVALVLPLTTAGAAGAFIGARANYAKKVKRAADAVELVLDELDR